MRAVAQRVSKAEVWVAGDCVAQIESVLLVYLGIGQGDSEQQCRWMSNKLAGLRIFADDNDKMVDSVRSLGLDLLVVSQFTLYGDVRKGTRPSFHEAARPALARSLYERVCELIRELDLRVYTGQFGAMMDVSAQVDGPVTILLESPVQ